MKACVVGLSIFCCLLAVVLPAAAAEEDLVRLDADAQRAASEGRRWLLKQQSKDGGWHSQTYGSLKDGAAVTMLALYAISQLPVVEGGEDQAAIDRGLAFVEPGRKLREGAVASPDGSFDYPTYATALWLQTRRYTNRKMDASDEEALAWLLAAQLTERRGFQPQDQAYGGWDLLGEKDATGITTGSNVSVTRFVLEALQPFHDRQDVIEARKKARIWLDRCLDQGTGGGFAFSPESAEHLHKAGMTEDKLPRAVSYGTTTADGLRGMLLAGVDSANKKLEGPISWLAKNTAVEVVPGFEQLSPEVGWQRGLRFYYAETLSAVISELPQPERDRRRIELYKSLLQAQQKDGSWKNDSARMREDDPLIATPLAILALHRLHVQSKP